MSWQPVLDLYAGKGSLLLGQVLQGNGHTMEQVFGYSDIAELLLMHLSGERLTMQNPGQSETTFNISARYEADALSARIGVQATVHAVGDESTVYYRGKVEYQIGFYGPAQTDQNAELIVLLWPYLRSGLLEQASRLGEPSLTVPVECPQLPPPNPSSAEA